MNPVPEHRRFTVLFVDDEAQARKYFPRLLEDQFRILTADGVDQALQLIEQHHKELGVVITDQRMPGRTGVDLLTVLRERHPGVVRILTTAYADIESAIAAVNSGHIYRYVVKPWDEGDLRQTLLRAMDLFLLQREREMLLREKLSTLQRLVVADRVRSYAVLATGLANRIKNPMLALKAFLDGVPVQEAVAAVPGGQVDWQELWTMAQRESQRVLDTVQQVVQRTTEPAFHFAETDICALLRSTLAPLQESMRGRGVALEAAIPQRLPAMQADPRMVARMLTILAERSLLIQPTCRRLTVSVDGTEVRDQPGVRIRIAADASEWTSPQLQACFAAPSASSIEAHGLESDLLTAFFIAYHHSGSLQLLRTQPRGPGFEACLPLTPEVVRMPDVDAAWVERIFTHHSD